MMKKGIALALALLMLFSLVSCGEGGGTSSPQPENTSSAAAVDMNVYTLKGPTGMGMTKLMADSDAGTASNNYHFTLSSAPDEIVSAISSGSADIAACPINLASTLYKKTGGAVEILAVNTLGVLYVLENGESIQSIADLKGKTIYATGQGSTPEYILNYVLEKNGIDPAADVTIEYKTEHSELATLAASGDAAIAVLPEPNVTAALAQSQAGLRIALDLTEEWEKVSDSKLAQGCIIVRKEFLEANADAVDKFLAEYGRSVTYVNENLDDASALIEQYGIMAKAALAKKAIPNCNIVFLTGNEMEQVARANLQVLFDANPSSVGGALPDDSFYYKGYQG
ncbi:MAG: ABC transporter substrate-binding protein [Candidatus Howiella sp.]